MVRNYHFSLRRYFTQEPLRKDQRFDARDKLSGNSTFLNLTSTWRWARAAALNKRRPSWPNLRAWSSVEAFMRTGKSRGTLLDLSFTMGTDDLRGSRQVELAKRRLGKGRLMRIWRPNDSLR